MCELTSSSKIISEGLKADTDFDYVRTLRDPEKRVAAYYEYARHSPEIVEMVKQIKRAGGLQLKLKGSVPVFNPAIPAEIAQLLIDQCDIYPAAEISILDQTEEFPHIPFRDARKGLKCLEHVDAFGQERPLKVPWNVVELLRSTVMRGGDGRSEFDYWCCGFRAKTLNAISIPWQYTDEEIAAFFRVLIPKLRPREYPEPKKAGRRGRSSGSRAIDLLNQLAACRFQRAGFEFTEIGKNTPYTSSKGWNKAVTAAEDRIRNMTQRPFFGERELGEIGN
jgi:hypothetical protein